MKHIDTAYRLFCKKRFPLPSKGDIIALEHRLDVSLPPDYRRYLLRHNGGYFTEPVIAAPALEHMSDRLTVMYGISASHPSAELASAASLAIFYDNDPVQVLPIGYTMMGNLLILIVAAPERGCIVLKKASSGDYFYLASGINEFFGLLREPQPDKNRGRS